MSNENINKDLFIPKGLYNELMYFLDSLDLKEDDVEYILVHRYPDPVEITLPELLELTKEVPDDVKAGQIHPFEMVFKNGYHIELEPDNKFDEMELKIWRGPLRTNRLGHLDSLLIKE